MTASWREYVDYYGDSLGAYLGRDHLDAWTISDDDHPRFRCSLCGAAVTVGTTDGTEYGHRRNRLRRGDGLCPHRDEETVGADGHPNQRQATGAITTDSD